MIRYLAVGVLATGCSTLLDLEPGTLVDPVPPSCEAGWATRIPIDIDNASGQLLTDYQVALPLDLRSAPQLRFGIDSAHPPLAFEHERDGHTTWIAVPALPPGTTRVYAYTDNPDADAWVPPSPFDRDLVTNASFETTGAWTIDDAGAHFNYSTTWASDGMTSLAVDAYRDQRVFKTLDYGVSQRVQFPVGTDFILRFDLYVVAASNGGLNSSGEFFVSIGDGLQSVWRKSGDEGNITGIYRDLETAPFGPGDVGVMLGVTLRDGTSSSYAKGFYDNVRARKHVTPEPAVTVTPPEDACASR